MSEQDRLVRKMRVWLYVIALLHLICLGLLHRGPADVKLTGSLYAMSSGTSSSMRL